MLPNHTPKGLPIFLFDVAVKRNRIIAIPNMTFSRYSPQNHTTLYFKYVIPKIAEMRQSTIAFITRCLSIHSTNGSKYRYNSMPQTHPFKTPTKSGA